MDKAVVTNQDEVIPNVATILDAQQNVGVTVKILWKDVLDKHDIHYPPDLIVFDDKAVHLHKGSGGWYTDVEILENEKQIEKWLKNFALLEKHCIVWRAEARK
jgi:nicotinamidase-related amidase